VVNERVRHVLRVPELADLLGISDKRAYGLISEGKVPGVIRLGRRLLLSRVSVERWLLGEDGLRAGDSNATLIENAKSGRTGI
jgi:excisionase family DNA binding protein